MHCSADDEKKGPTESSDCHGLKTPGCRIYRDRTSLAACPHSLHVGRTSSLHKLDSPVSVVRSQCIAPVETLQHERNCAADHLFRQECERVPERDIQNSIAKYSCEAARYIGFISVRGLTRADRIDSCGRGSVSGRQRLVPIAAPPTALARTLRAIDNANSPGPQTTMAANEDQDRLIASLRRAVCPDRGRRFRAAGVRLFAPSRATGNQKNPVPAFSGNAPALLTPRPRPGA